MPALFKHISQVVTWADYQKLLRRAVADPPPTASATAPLAFHYFESFPFDQKLGSALLLVGEVSKSLLEEVRRLAGKTDRAQGSLRLAEGQALSLEVETGRVKPRLVALTLKQAGVMLEVRLADEPAAVPPQAAPAAPAPQATPPAEPAVPSSQAQDWAAKLQKFQPHFEKALLALRNAGDEARVGGLQAQFGQMTGQAAAGQWDNARNLMRELVRAVQTLSVEAAEPTAAPEVDPPPTDTSAPGPDTGPGELDQAERLTASEWEEHVRQALQTLQALVIKTGAEWTQVTASELREPLEWQGITLARAERLSPRGDTAEFHRSHWPHLISGLRKAMDTVRPKLWDLKQQMGEYSARPEAKRQQIHALGEHFALMAHAAAALEDGRARLKALESRQQGLAMQERRLRQALEAEEKHAERQAAWRDRTTGTEATLEADAEHRQDLRDELDRLMQVADALKRAAEQPSQRLDAARARSLLEGWKQAEQALASTLQAQDYPAAVRALDPVYPLLHDLLQPEPGAEPDELAAHGLMALEQLSLALNLAERTAGFSWPAEKPQVINLLAQMHSLAVAFRRECLPD